MTEATDIKVEARINMSAPFDLIVSHTSTTTLFPNAPKRLVTDPKAYANANKLLT